MTAVLREAEWRARQARHADRLRPFAEDRVGRMMRQEKHPVRDFLFEYYSFRPPHLLRWSPGVGVLLENARPTDLEWGRDFTAGPNGLVLTAESFPAHRVSFAEWALEYLEGIAARPPLLGCFGLHEWAMVYREPTVRHTRTPLRLSPDAIAAAVEAQELCCTHYDAFRFFTPAAVPRNRQALTREVTTEFDQRGCIHVTMDLYRYAYKIAPWVTGELLADAFLLAWEARQVDMRASPYDLAAYGLAPIPVETPDGKAEYVACQRALAARAVPVRARLIAEYRSVQVGRPETAEADADRGNAGGPRCASASAVVASPAHFNDSR